MVDLSVVIRSSDDQIHRYLPGGQAADEWLQLTKNREILMEKKQAGLVWANGFGQLLWYLWGPQHFLYKLSDDRMKREDCLTVLTTLQWFDKQSNDDMIGRRDTMYFQSFSEVPRPINKFFS